MSNSYTFEETIDLARSNTDVKPLHELLGRLIRINRTPRDSDEINAIRDRAWESVLRKLQLGQTSSSIAKQLRKIVTGAVLDEVRRAEARPSTNSLDSIDSVALQKVVPASPSAEYDCFQIEECRKIFEAILVLGNSDKVSDQRYYEAIVAAERGRSVVDALRNRFGEEVSTDNANHIVSRGRAKLESLLKASGNKRAS